MPNSQYNRGRAAEYRAKRILEVAGYTVARTAGSHGCADLIAWNAQGFRLCQIKRGAANASPAERETFALLSCPPGTAKEIWRFIAKRKPPVIEIL